jgi:quercetin dioxygenase-like cupin family protein
VLKGELGVKASQEEIRVKPGEAVFISPGDLHGNFNAGGGEIEYIAVTCKVNP